MTAMKLQLLATCAFAALVASAADAVLVPDVKPGARAAASAALAAVPEVVYVTHAAFHPDHHNTATIFQRGEINEGSYDTQGALKAWNPATGATRVIVPEKKGRTIRDPEVDWDGRRIVFAMRDGRPDDYHIYVVNADGTGLRQLTREKGVSDIDPAFLPDGDIVFASTRNPKYCMCNRHIMANLYRMEADGANIHQIGVSTLFEGHPSILPDGRVLYDRWEYVDRNFGDAQGLWTCNPDGTRHAVWWGNNTTSPGGVINARAVGGDSTKAIAILGSCHDRPWGALGLIDRTRGVDGRDPVLRTWPASYRDRIHDGGKEDFDSTRSLPCKYADPFPIDDSHFLAVRMKDRGGEMSLVYLDLDGNEVELLADAPGIWSPVALRPSRKPVVQSRQRNFDAPNAPGRFYLQNVHVGTHMQGVAPGTVKALRVVESPEKRTWTGPKGWFGHGEEAPAMNWHSFENKRVLGTVPVEEDGSAYFEVPANTFVYFQALDAEGKMVQSMRSGVFLQPGETYGCVGCHENRVGEAAPVAAKPLAMRREPSRLDGAYNLAGLEKGTPPHFYSFQREVQPVFTARCASCHDYGAKAGEKLNLSGDRGAFFCTSYVDLWALGYVKCIGGGPAPIQPAYSWGAHASRLTKKLYGHARVNLTDEERARIITWMDLNAPYYPRYECAYPSNPGGRMPLTFKERKTLEELCGAAIANVHGKRQREQLDFDRPACSRILAGIAGTPAHAQALAIIEEGAARLRARPRCDMEGFVPCAIDQSREARYQRRLGAERRAYDAIRAGRKIYDGADAVVFQPGRSEIVVESDACDTVRLAAEEAREFMGGVLGCDVPIVTTPSPSRTALFLGPSRWADAEGVTTNGLKRDGFRIRTASNRVYVVGIDDPTVDAHRNRQKGGIWLQNFERATVFGVYDFLERFAGVRFYFPGELGTVVPKAAKVEVPPTDIVEAPANTVRRYTIYETDSPYFEGENPAELRHPMKTVNWWRTRMETEYMPCCHGQVKFRYIERFAKSHPEYFALLEDGRRHNSFKITYPGHPGQLCHTSAVWEELYQDVKSYLSGEDASARLLPAYGSPGSAGKVRYGWGVNCQRRDIVDVMPQDGMIKCACERCKAEWAKAPEIGWASDLIWGNVVRLANRLKAEGVKGRVSMMAYSKYRRVPDFPFPDNVEVMVAERGPWTENDPPERARELSEIRAWHDKIGRKVSLWTYLNKPNCLPDVPNCTPKAIARYYQQLAPLIYGSFMQDFSDHWLSQYLGRYVFGKVMWNPAVDVEAILDEHHRLMFGPAAPEMKRFFEEIERIYITRVAGRTIDTALGPQSEKPSPYDLFVRIYTPEVLDALEALFDAASAKVAAGSLEARRIALIRRELFDPLARRAREYVSSIDVEKGLARDMASKKPNLVPVKVVPDGNGHLVGKPPQTLFGITLRDAGGKSSLKPGRRYRLSYCVRLENVKPVKLNGGVNVSVWAGMNFWMPQVPFSGTQDRTYQSFEFTAGADSITKGPSLLRLRLVNATGDAWFDNVRIEEVDD